MVLQVLVFELWCYQALVQPFWNAYFYFATHSVEQILTVYAHSFTDNAGLCGIPGLRPCGPHLSTAGEIGVGVGVFIVFLLIVICSMCWWKRRQNILRAQRIAGNRRCYVHNHSITSFLWTMFFVIKCEKCNIPYIFSF